MMYILGTHYCPSSFLISSSTPAPIAWPMAKMLDYVLGANETHTYKKAELKSFLQFHRQGEEPLRDDEISILNGVLELNNKRAEEIMTPMKVRVGFLEINDGAHQNTGCCDPQLGRYLGPCHDGSSVSEQKNGETVAYRCRG
jgi:CBS domain containing-hemolysin-like protein